MVTHQPFVDLSLSLPRASPAESTLLQEYRAMTQGSFHRSMGILGGNYLGEDRSHPSSSMGRPAIRLLDCVRLFVQEEELEEVECEYCCIDYLQERLSAHSGSEVQRVVDVLQQWKASGLWSHGRYNSWDETVTEELLSDASDAWTHTIEENADSVRASVSKHLFLSRLPPALCLHINRRVQNEITGHMMKLTQHVSFPLILDLSQFMSTELAKSAAVVSPPSVDIGSLTAEMTAEGNSAQKLSPYFLYSLKAVVVHSGSADEGHYATYALVEEPVSTERGPLDSVAGWVYFSDTLVRPVNVTDVLQAQAYLLFYEQQPQQQRLTSIN